MSKLTLIAFPTLFMFLTYLVYDRFQGFVYSTIYAVIVTVLIAAAIGGFNIFGWGLNSEATRIIIFTTALSTLWISYIAGAMDFITQIPLGFGFIIEGIFTLIYVIGIVNYVSPGSE